MDAGEVHVHNHTTAALAEPSGPEVQANLAADAAAKSRSVAIDETRRRVEQLEHELAVLEATRDQAHAAWTRAEENIRAELGGVRAFLDTACAPLPSECEVPTRVAPRS
jgi:hypothetical protein